MSKIIDGKKYTVDLYRTFPPSSFGIIQLLTSKEDGKKYILKTANKFKDEKTTTFANQMLEREFNILNKIKDCKHIIKSENYEKESNEMLMQYASGGDLHYFITNNKISLFQLISYSKQLFEAVNCFHSLNVYNLDIKPENVVFLDQEHKKLAVIDFGLSQNNPMNSCYGTYGTQGFIAPEVGKHDPYMCSKADIFSLGILFKELLENTLYEKGNYIADKFQVLVSKLTVKDPNKRGDLSLIKDFLDMDEVKELLSDTEEYEFVFKSKSLKRVKTPKKSKNQKRVKTPKKSKSLKRVKTLKKSKSQKKVKSLNKTKLKKL